LSDVDVRRGAYRASVAIQKFAELDIADGANF